MSTQQTEAQLLIAAWNDSWRTPISPTKSAKAGGEMAAELLRLEAANAELLEALETARDHIPMDALEVSHSKDAQQIRATIEKHGGKA